MKCWCQAGDNVVLLMEMRRFLESDLAIYYVCHKFRCIAVAVNTVIKKKATMKDYIYIYVITHHARWMMVVWSFAWHKFLTFENLECFKIHQSHTKTDFVSKFCYHRPARIHKFFTLSSHSLSNCLLRHAIRATISDNAQTISDNDNWASVLHLIAGLSLIYDASDIAKRTEPIQTDTAVALRSLRGT
jgi:hypothetical protein